MSTTIQRRDGGYFTVPNRWIDAGYMAAAPGSVTQVYLHLSRWADNGTLQSSQPMRLIAKKCGLSEDIARKAVRTLEAWGVLDRDPDAGRNAKNVWYLNDLLQQAPEYPDKVTPKESRGPKKVGVQQSEGPYQPNHYQPEIKDQPEDVLASTTNSDEDFESWWTVYPRKVKKADARKAFEKINPDPETLARMIADVQARSRSRDWNEEGGKFIPHPTTYLNQQRWEDEDDPAPSVTPLPGQHLSQNDLRKLPMSAWKYGVYEFGSAGAAVFRKDWEAGTLPQLDGSRP